MVHGAGVVMNGKGYLFYGPSGAGKSTLARLAKSAAVIGDDISVVLPGEEKGLELVGNPFRGAFVDSTPVSGGFPLQAGFRLVKAAEVEVREVSRARALGELVANLPYVAEAFDDSPGLFARVERAFQGVPLYHLLFRKDDSYWDAIERAGLLERLDAGPENLP
mgnify:CR=1 FL=1